MSSLRIFDPYDHNQRDEFVAGRWVLSSDEISTLYYAVENSSAQAALEIESLEDEVEGLRGKISALEEAEAAAKLDKIKKILDE